MKARPVQYFTKEYIDRCKDMTPEQILQFLEDFKLLFSETHEKEKCQLISMKIEPSLLRAFKQKSKLENTPYQTQIKKLMKEWLQKPKS